MFQDLRNSIDFFIRNKTRFSRKNFEETNPDLLDRNYKENLYTKDVLSKYFEKQSLTSARILDIGCKNWFYAKGEYNYFSEFLKDFEMEGVEIDAYRLYSNFYSRYEVAKYHIKDLKNVRYIADDLLNLNKKYEYIVWFLPFMLIEPLIYWGLPRKFFCPEKLLLHAYNLLNVTGQMLIINQGKEEFEFQKKILKNLGIPYQDLGEIKSEYFEYKNKRFGVLVKK